MPLVQHGLLGVEGDGSQINSRDKGGASFRPQ